MALRFSDFDDLRAYLARLAGKDLSTAGAWSAGQIFYHLAATFEASCGPGTPGRSAWARLTKLPQRVYVLHFGPPRGVQIPAEVRERVTPPPDAEAGEQLARLQRAIDPFEAKTDGFPLHPALGPLTRADWRRFHFRHCELHLSYIVIPPA